MLLAQAASEPTWVQYGFAGLTGLLLTFGIPWLLKHLRERDEKHAATIEKMADEHTERVNKIVDDHRVERNVHIANMDRVCCTFEKTMNEERAACERRFEWMLKRQSP